MENQIEELGAHIVELENEINDPEVLRDHLLLRDKCDELDDTRFHQQELYDEWKNSPRSRKPSRPRTHNTRRAYSRPYTKNLTVL